MHKIQEKEFTLDDFSCEYLVSESIANLEDNINLLNKFRAYYNEYDVKNHFYIDNDSQIVDKKVIWEQMIQLLPSSYNQTRNVMLNYEVLANIYKSRRNHKLDEWREFCKWIEKLPYSELITGSPSLKGVEVGKAAVTGISDGIGNADPDIVDGFKGTVIPKVNLEDIKKAVSADSGRGDGLWQPGNEF